MLTGIRSYLAVTTPMVKRQNPQSMKGYIGGLCDVNDPSCDGVSKTQEYERFRITSQMADGFTIKYVAKGLAKLVEPEKLQDYFVNQFKELNTKRHQKPMGELEIRAYLYCIKKNVPEESYKGIISAIRKKNKDNILLKEITKEIFKEIRNEKKEI